MKNNTCLLRFPEEPAGVLAALSSPCNSGAWTARAGVSYWFGMSIRVALKCT